ncbi:MAG: rhomboid family intramembrane serine protease [Ferruginibacter sp.]
MSTTVLIIAVNVFVFFGTRSNGAMIDKLIFWPYYVKRQHEYYRFITSGFMHADTIHLFFNMFTLFFFGDQLESVLIGISLVADLPEKTGTALYLGLYVLSIVAADMSTYSKYRDDIRYRSLGASGAVSAVVFACIVLMPWNSIYLYGALKLSSLLYAVLFLWYCIYMSKRGGDNVNHDAHLWGSVSGVIFMGILLFMISPALFQRVLAEFMAPFQEGNLLQTLKIILFGR